MLQVLVLGGAALTLGNAGCGGGSDVTTGQDAGIGAGMDAGADAGHDAGTDAGTADAGSDAGTADAGSDAGTDGGSDAGLNCHCTPDPNWPGDDCLEVGHGPAVCCWLTPTATCCP